MNRDETIIKNFKQKSFLKIMDFSKEELTQLIDLSIMMKKAKKENIPHKLLKDKNIALIFEKPSTRTRAAFSVAGRDLGANIDYFGKEELHIGEKESIEDTAIVLGRMYDAIEFRGHRHQDVEALSASAKVPVWNGLTDEWHPTQMIADFMTITEVFGSLEDKTLSYIGDGRNNIARDLLITGSILGVNVNIISPEKLFPDDDIIQMAQQYATLSGSKINISSDIDKTIVNSDVIYTDVWFSMGESKDLIDERIQLLKPFQVNQQLLEKTKNPNTIVLHCLPAFHDTNTNIGLSIHNKYDLEAMEITDQVFQTNKEMIFNQAENRLHSIKAIMAVTLGDMDTFYEQMAI
ncbi:ornithine carbamoyltransferase [Macrococcus sp. DPC7161]|uniref:ornithine carbamoyltransferase n=1 Tax=Macrococcus sp. DPC7161 TaxID=2507060 RepID=UPI00100A8797|nr:ornithine carbamoyltransferase [Macrococcus sp. DPC7161]RXK17659.1 ornithine carbamoyltransferase [Macrococcus sp. DPC7161]